jgi:glycosyltransferase involved in cell wall biosynthesis
MLKFAKYLRETGWEPVIFTAEGAHYPTVDPTNERDVPEGVEVIRQPIWEPYALYKKFMGKSADENVNNVFYSDDADGGWKHKAAVWVRSNFFIPDARATWIKGSVKRLTSYLVDHPVDAIISDGPPHTNTRIATLVSRATETPWLADFQDPWTQVDYYQLLNLTSWGRKKHERQEQEAFAQASRTTTVSSSWKRDLEAIGAKNVAVIPYGYDPEDFADLKRTGHKKFTLTHLGIMGYDRNPVNLFRAIALLKKEVPGFAEDVELRLFGQLDYRVKKNILAEGIGEQTNFAGNVTRAEALQQQVDSHLLLLLLNQQDNAKGRIPGKLFEYLAARRPILNFGGTDSDVAGILTATDSGSTFAYDESPEAIAGMLKIAYQDFKSSKERPMNDEVIKPYSHPVLVKKLGELLDEMVG